MGRPIIRIALCALAISFGLPAAAAFALPVTDGVLPWNDTTDNFTILDENGVRRNLTCHSNLTAIV